jgi:peptidoglycan/LPS O-acetylase OafA/YrhL
MKTTQLTFTRFLAAFAIVLHHYSLSIEPYNINPFKTIVAQANIGVSYFFILSGFVMVVAYGQKNNLNKPLFFKNRLARIYPLYILATILMILFFVLAKIGVDATVVILNIFMLQAWIPSMATAVNAQTWSISVECFFYLLFPFLLQSVYKKFQLKFIVFWGLLLWGITQICFNVLLHSDFYTGFLTNSYHFLYFFPLFHLNEFILGNIAGLFFLRYLPKGKKSYDVVLLCLFAGLVFYLSKPERFSAHNGLLAIVFIPMILLLCWNTGKITKLFSMKFFVFLGEMSYAMYLLQNPVFSFSISILKRIGITDLTACFYIRLFLLLIASALCYAFFEKPARNWIRRLDFMRKEVTQMPI